MLLQFELQFGASRQDQNISHIVSSFMRIFIKDVEEEHNFCDAQSSRAMCCHQIEFQLGNWARLRRGGKKEKLVTALSGLTVAKSPILDT